MNFPGKPQNVPPRGYGECCGTASSPPPAEVHLPKAWGQGRNGRGPLVHGRTSWTSEFFREISKFGLEAREREPGQRLLTPPAWARTLHLYLANGRRGEAPGSRLARVHWLELSGNFEKTPFRGYQFLEKSA